MDCFIWKKNERKAGLEFGGGWLERVNKYYFETIRNFAQGF